MYSVGSSYPTDELITAPFNLVQYLWSGSMSVPTQVNFYVDNPNIATVDPQTGLLTAKSEGETTLRGEVLINIIKNCGFFSINCPYFLTATPAKVEVSSTRLIITELSPADGSVTKNTPPKVSALIKVHNPTTEVKATMRMDGKIVKDEIFKGAKSYTLEYPLTTESFGSHHVIVEAEARIKDEIGRDLSYEFKSVEWNFGVYRTHFDVYIEPIGTVHPDKMVGVLIMGENIRLAPNSPMSPSNFIWSRTSNGIDDSQSGSISIGVIDTDENEKSKMVYTVSITFSYQIEADGYVDMSIISRKNSNLIELFHLTEKLKGDETEKSNTITKKFDLTFGRDKIPGIYLEYHTFHRGVEGENTIRIESISFTSAE